MRFIILSEFASQMEHFWGGRDRSWPCIRLFLVVKKMLLNCKEEMEEICTRSFKIRAIIPPCVFICLRIRLRILIQFFLF